MTKQPSMNDSCIFDRGDWDSNFSNKCVGDCRKFKFKIITEWSEIDGVAKDNNIDGFIIDRCKDEDERNHFKNSMNQWFSNTFEYIGRSRNLLHCPLNLPGCLSPFCFCETNPECADYILAYIKKPSAYNNNLECCNYTKESNDYKRLNCGPHSCRGSKMCDIDNILLSDQCKLDNFKKCADTFNKSSKNAKIDYINKFNNNIVKIIEELNKNPSNVKAKEFIENDMIKEMLSSEANTDIIQSKLKEFCNDTKIFDGTDWDNKISEYGKICNCFWDADVDNDNPAKKHKQIIDGLQDKKDIPEELKKYFQYASDINPIGPTYCWDRDCINKDNNLKPNTSKCPSTNTAGCLAYINFDNKGLIKGDITNIANCIANLNNSGLNNFLGGGSSPPGSPPGSPPDGSNGNGGKKKKNNITIWIIVGVVVVVLLIIIIIAIALSGSDPPQQGLPILYS